MYSVGLHPWQTDTPLLARQLLDRLPAWLAHPQVVAVGECGLDALRGADLKVQTEYLTEQLAWAGIWTARGAACGKGFRPRAATAQTALPPHALDGAWLPRQTGFGAATAEGGLRFEFRQAVQPGGLRADAARTPPTRNRRMRPTLMHVLRLSGSKKTTTLRQIGDKTRFFFAYQVCYP